jgi:hypothetical protein
VPRGDSSPGSSTKLLRRATLRSRRQRCQAGAICALRLLHRVISSSGTWMRSYVSPTTRGQLRIRSWHGGGMLLLRRRWLVGWLAVSGLMVLHRVPVASWWPRWDMMTSMNRYLVEGITVVVIVYSLALLRGKP